MIYQRRNTNLSLVSLLPSDTYLVNQLLNDMNSYLQIVEGVSSPPSDMAKSILTEMPPGVAEKNKYCFSFVSGNEPIGLADFVYNYPVEGTTTLGLFALADKWQKQGLGRSAFLLCLQWLQSLPNSKILRIAVVDGNPVIGFWHHMGFVDTGERREYQTVKLERKPVTVMECYLGNK